ncbi:MAG: HPF/RaiA family ribosome-associated protein [Burkholderiales bacterium]
MHNPVEIALRGVPASGALERYIGEEARKLDRICDRIRSCQVVAETLQREKRQGAQFAVRLVITLPGTEVVVNREHDDVYMALRNAFAAAGLQLKDHMRRLGKIERRSNGGTPDPGN